MHPLIRVLLAAVSASVLGYGLYKDTTQLPLAHEGAVLGKGIFLTYQTEIILTTYFCLELAAASSNLLGAPLKGLDRFTTWASPLAGGFGLYLTSAFYAVCWFNEVFQRDVVEKFEAQGIPMRFICHLIHGPSSVLVLLDTLAKDGDTVRVCVGSAGSYLKYFVAFGVWYVFVVRWNYSVTKKWVYPFMDDFTADWQHWAFYCLSFGWIWLLAVLHRSVMVKVVAGKKEAGKEAKSKTK